MLSRSATSFSSPLILIFTEIKKPYPQRPPEGGREYGFKFSPRSDRSSGAFDSHASLRRCDRIRFEGLPAISQALSLPPADTPSIDSTLNKATSASQIHVEQNGSPAAFARASFSCVLIRDACTRPAARASGLGHFVRPAQNIKQFAPIYFLVVKAQWLNLHSPRRWASALPARNDNASEGARA